MGDLSVPRRISWRLVARRAIAGAIEATAGQPEAEVIKRIDETRMDHRGYVYKVWLEERRIALARLRGQHLTVDQARKASPEVLVPLVPVPELKAWLTRQGRRAMA